MDGRDLRRVVREGGFGDVLHSVGIRDINKHDGAYCHCWLLN